MSCRYLLDTNILSDLIKQPQGRAAQGIGRVGENGICTSIVVACELRYGARKKGSPILSDKIEQILSAIEILSLEAEASIKYGEIRFNLEKLGSPIGAMDMLIAAHAMSQDLILVTGNTAEFQRIPGIKLENWLQN